MRNRDPDLPPFWNNLRLVRAVDWRDAFVAATALGVGDAQAGREAFSYPTEFVGITDLVPIYEKFEHGSEILWQEFQPEEGTAEGLPLEIYDESHFRTLYGEPAD